MCKYAIGARVCTLVLFTSLCTDGGGDDDGNAPIIYDDGNAPIIYNGGDDAPIIYGEPGGRLDDTL